MIKFFSRVHKFDLMNYCIHQIHNHIHSENQTYTSFHILHGNMANNNIYMQWQELTPEEQGFYLEFNRPLINNQREIPDNEEMIYWGACRPMETHMNAVCDTGDRLVRTLNFSLTPSQRNAIIAWMVVNAPDHPDPFIN